VLTPHSGRWAVEDVDEEVAKAMNLKRGCALVGVSAVIIVTLLLGPYQAESIESVTSANETGCTISTTSNGGWRTGFMASRVAYPLNIVAFVDNCPNVSGGKPYSSELVSLSSGKVIARGQACADDRGAPEEYPCRLELPPLATLRGKERYVVRVVRTAALGSSTAEIRLFLKREWRIAVWDAILSV
jgi:hypothetical protein